MSPDSGRPGASDAAATPAVDAAEGGFLTDVVQAQHRFAERALVALQADLDRRRRDFEQALKSDIALLERQREDQRRQLETERVGFDRERTMLADRDRELAEREARLAARQGSLDEQEAALGRLVEAKARERVKLATDEASQLRRERDGLVRRVAELESAASVLGKRSAAEASVHIQMLENENARLKEELAYRQRGVDPQSAGTVQQLEIENRRLQAAQADTTMKLGRAKVWQIQNEMLSDEVNALTTGNEGHLTTIGRLRRTIEELTAKPDLARDREARLTMIEMPIADEDFSLAKGKAKAPPGDEQAWLGEVERAIRDAGFVFPPRLLRAFHTCLKIAEWAPLTVLSGVSGTGKSELPRLYALAGGLRYLMTSVQTNWETPQELFGFFNYMDNRFNARPLLRAMAQSQRADKGGFLDGMLLVLLDEMNLSRVELYLSDLLSKLELRRGLAPGRTVAVDIDLGSGLEPFRLDLGANVLFAGTMNTDETTYALSDKAIDRSNVLMFERPRQFHSRDEAKLPAAVAPLPRKTWESWQVLKLDDAAIDRTHRDRLRGEMELINAALATVGKALGHRVWQAVERYLANHPEVRSAKSKDAETFAKALTVAFEDQLVQKIMPKLHGIELTRTVKSSCLDQVADVINRAAPGLSDDFAEAIKSGEVFIWHANRYLEDPK